MAEEARLHNVSKTVFSTNGGWKTGQLHEKKKKMELDHSFTSYTKISSGWIKDHTIKHKKTQAEYSLT